MLLPEVTRRHPLEDAARTLQPDLTLCVVDQGRWLQLLGESQVTSGNSKRLEELIVPAMRARFEHCIPGFESDVELEPWLRALGLEDSKTDIVTLRTGRRYAYVVLGPYPLNFQEHLAALGCNPNHLKPTLVPMAEQLVRLWPRLAEFHELAHVCLSEIGSKDFARLQVAARFHARHRAEVQAMAFENLSLLQDTQDLTAVRLNCDLTLLQTFYLAASAVADRTTGDVEARSTTYYAPNLFEEIATFHRRVGADITRLSLRDLMMHAKTIASRTELSAAALQQVTQAFWKARLALDPSAIHSDSFLGLNQTTRQTDQLPAEPLVAKAVKAKLLDPRQAHVSVLLAAEQRTLSPTQ